MNGFLNVIKPIGLSSHDVVGSLREALPSRLKVGHAGTLDPCATGVLVICIGTATRLSEYVCEQEKAYVAEFTFGASTDTDDCCGQVLEVGGASTVAAEAVEGLLPQFCGLIQQVPPAFSAVSKRGVRSYKLARRGRPPELEPRQVHVKRFRLLRFVPGEFPRGLFEIVCSRGTYVRSLCRDMGKALGCGAFVSFLVRTRVGAFSIEDSLALEDVLRQVHQGTLEGSIVAPWDALPMPSITIGDEDLNRVISGAAPAKRLSLPDGLEVLLVHPARGAVGVGIMDRGGIVLEKVLNTQDSGGISVGRLTL